MAQVNNVASFPRRFFSFFGNVAGCLLIVWLVDETNVFKSTALDATLSGENLMSAA